MPTPNHDPAREHPPTVKRLGDPRGKDATWTLMPPAPDVCQQCAHDHPPELPHNAQSLYYQYAFHAEHDRWPTWRDAMAHCSPEVQEGWVASLAKFGITDLDGPPNAQP